MGVGDEDELVSGVLVQWPHGGVREAIGYLDPEAGSDVWARRRFGNRWAHLREDADTRRRGRRRALEMLTSERLPEEQQQSQG